MDPQVVLRRLVEMSGGPTERGYVLALMSTGLEALPTELSTSAGKYAVVHPTSEVSLRHLLWQAGGAPVLALLDEPLARRLPADLVRRARGARVHAVEPGEVLSLALGVRVVADDDPAMQQLALQQVDAIRAQLGQRTLPTVVDRDLLDELLLDVVAEGQLRKLAPGAILAEWCRHPPVVEPVVRDLLRRQLPRVHGLPGRVLSWAAPKKDRIEALVINGVLLALDEPELPPSVWGPLGEAPHAVELTPETFRHIVAGLARQALEGLGDGAAHYLARAESIGRKALTPSVLKRSEELPLGLKNLCVDTAQLAASGHAVGHDVIQRMRRHRFAAAHRADIDVLEEVARLSRYLAAAGPGDGATVATRVRHYQRNGAFADWSATQLRLSLAASTEHARAAEAVLDRYRTRRNEENHGFAELLQAGYTSALHAEGVVPLHQIWRNAPLRQASEERTGSSCASSRSWRASSSRSGSASPPSATRPTASRRSRCSPPSPATLEARSSSTRSPRTPGSPRRCGATPRRRAPIRPGSDRTRRSARGRESSSSRAISPTTGRRSWARCKTRAWRWWPRCSTPSTIRSAPATRAPRSW